MNLQHTVPSQREQYESCNVPVTPRYVGQVREWIQACNRLHGETCVPKPTPQRPPEDLPHWLIDAHQQCIVPGFIAHQYSALSYVWPESRGPSGSDAPVPRTLLLDSESVADCQRPGYLEHEAVTHRIPMVIRHAIDLTKALGIRYLWVDRLCIVQNDPGDGGTSSQIAKMDKIYAGAYLTIIAAAPQEMYENGLVHGWPTFKTERREYRYSRDSSRLHGQRNDESKPSDLSEDEAMEIMSKRYNALSKSKWATRGWTYQEQILCTRAVVLTETGLFWDCHCCMWDGVDLIPGQVPIENPIRARKGQPLATRWWPDFGFYLDLVCPYNGRDYTYPQDALSGFQGILSALGNSFPGGFIHGLPRLFLDHAFLWQPFGIATRRVNSTDVGTVNASLPSWSWCGWQCYVDPQSLCTGLSYMDSEHSQQRAGSWRTRSLVDWHISVRDQTPEPVREPCLLDRYKELYPATDGPLPEGWIRHNVMSLVSNVKHPASADIFTHTKDQSTHFRHPIPLRNHLENPSLITVPAYLTGLTSKATFVPGVCLKHTHEDGVVLMAAPKVAVSEDLIFKQGPPRGKGCSILVLKQSNGAFAGLLRLMDNDLFNFTSPLELIALSTGSATAEDLRRAFEWRIYDRGADVYRFGSTIRTLHYEIDPCNDDGRHALLFDIETAFHKSAADVEFLKQYVDKTLDTMERNIDEVIEAEAKSAFGRWKLERYGPPTEAPNRMEHWFSARRNIVYKALAKSRAESAYSSGLPEQTPPSEANAGHHDSRNQDDFTCEFYNVLWIERKAGIAYRRACGWVPKYIWEAYAIGAVEVKLG